MTRSIGVAIPLALILGAFLAFIACRSDPPSQNRTASNQANQVDPGDESSLAAPRCDPSATPSVQASDLKTHFLRNGTGDADLERQRANGYYTVDFVAIGDTVVMKVKGKITGEGEDGIGTAAVKVSKLKHLIEKLDKYLKKGCADVVSFEKLSADANASGFEWIVCESPQEPCGGGRCAMPGQCKRNDNNNSGNVVNGNANVNPIGNTNVNSNSNRTSNSTSGP